MFDESADLPPVHLTMCANIKEDDIGLRLDVDHPDITRDRESPVACELAGQCVVVERHSPNPVHKQPESIIKLSEELCVSGDSLPKVLLKLAVALNRLPHCGDRLRSRRPSHTRAAPRRRSAPETQWQTDAAGRRPRASALPTRHQSSRSVPPPLLSPRPGCMPAPNQSQVSSPSRRAAPEWCGRLECVAWWFHSYTKHISNGHDCVNDYPES